MVAERSFSLEPFWYFWLLGNNLPHPKPKTYLSQAFFFFLDLALLLLLALEKRWMKRLRDMVKSVHHGNIHGEEVYSFTKNGFNILAHFHGGKIDRILYSRESRGKLSDEEITTFLRANNHGRPMNEDLPYIWIGKDVAAT